ncbi:hypothetical protein MRX96_009063 [Rhipicephalus microplus]
MSVVHVSCLEHLMNAKNVDHCEVSHRRFETVAQTTGIRQFFYWALQAGSLRVMLGEPDLLRCHDTTDRPQLLLLHPYRLTGSAGRTHQWTQNSMCKTWVRRSAVLNYGQLSTPGGQQVSSRKIVDVGAASVTETECTRQLNV